VFVYLWCVVDSSSGAVHSSIKRPGSVLTFDLAAIPAAMKFPDRYWSRTMRANKNMSNFFQSDIGETNLQSTHGIR
jgi:hypothetical protein